MSFTNFCLGDNWADNEWPEVIRVHHESSYLDTKTYVERLTCRFVHDADGNIVCSLCGDEIEPNPMWDYCPCCGARRSY